MRMLVLGGCNLYNIAKVFEYSCVNIQGFCSLGIYGYDAAFCGVVVFHAVHAFGDCLISKVKPALVLIEKRHQYHTIVLIQLLYFIK